MATLTHAAFTRMGESTAEDWAATIPAHRSLERGSVNHPEPAAAILKPFVSETNR